MSRKKKSAVLAAMAIAGATIPVSTALPAYADVYTVPVGNEPSSAPGATPCQHAAYTVTQQSWWPGWAAKNGLSKLTINCAKDVSLAGPDGMFMYSTSSKEGQLFVRDNGSKNYGESLAIIAHEAGHAINAGLRARFGDAYAKAKMLEVGAKLGLPMNYIQVYPYNPNETLAGTYAECLFPWAGNAVTITRSCNIIDDVIYNRPLGTYQAYSWDHAFGTMPLDPYAPMTTSVKVRTEAGTTGGWIGTKWPLSANSGAYNATTAGITMKSPGSTVPNTAVVGAPTMYNGKYCKTWVRVSIAAGQSDPWVWSSLTAGMMYRLTGASANGAYDVITNCSYTAP